MPSSFRKLTDTNIMQAKKKINYNMRKFSLLYMYIATNMVSFWLYIALFPLLTMPEQSISILPNCTFGEYIIGAPKILNNYGAIKLFFGLFSMAPCTVIALDLLCLIFYISSLLLFFFAHQDSCRSSGQLLLFLDFRGNSGKVYNIAIAILKKNINLIYFAFCRHQ